MALDVTDNANVVEVVESIVQKAGRIDILINNAGLACFGTHNHSSAMCCGLTTVKVPS
jgi:NADP-dependent 3-hydroxy acid dehydrogenase YdfG